MSSAEKALIDNLEHEQGAELDQRTDICVTKDTKYSWFVCSCTFLTQVFILGVLHAYGVFFVEFVKEFKAPKGEAAWIGSLAYGLSMLVGPVTSVLVSRYGYSRIMMIGGTICTLSLLVSSFATSILMLFLTFSVFYGVGTSMCTSPTMTITAEYFDKYLTVATGITCSGSSFGTLIIGPFSQAIIDKVGWRTAFRILAGFTALTIILNSRIRPQTKPSSKQKQRHHLLHDLQIWKSRVFVVWTMSISLVMFGFYIPYVHLVSYAIDQGISPDRASMLMLILGATTAVGRIMFGRIVQQGVLNRLHMHQLSMLVTGTGVMLLPLIKSYIGIVLYVVTVGLVDGCFVVLLPIMTASLVGIENSVLAWGFMIGTSSITFTLGPPVAGAIFDKTGSYDVAFHCAGVPIVVGAILLFFIPWAQRTSSKTNILSMINEYTIDAPNTTDMGMGAACPDASARPICTDELVAQNVITAKSHVTVRSTGTSPVSHASSVDKSTSTSNVSLQQYPMDIVDALSQLSYNDRMFDDMLRQSFDGSYSNGTQSVLPQMDTSQTLPPSPPPSDPVRYRRTDDTTHDWKGSISSNYIVSVSKGSDRERTSESSSLHPSQASNIMQNSHLSPAVTVHSVTPEMTANQLFILPMAGPFQSAPLSRSQQASPKPQSHANSASNTTGNSDPSKQPSSFDQTISAHISMMLGTLVSPNSSDSKIEKSQDGSSRSSSCSNSNQPVSLLVPGQSTLNPHINIQAPTPIPAFSGSSGNWTSLQTALPASEPWQGTSKIQNIPHSEQGPSTRPTSDLAEITFEHDNQVTVIPKNNPFAISEPPHGTRLEDLFKAKVVEGESVGKSSSSYELISVESQDGVQQTKSNTGELDVFTHLFDDEEAQ